MSEPREELRIGFLSFGHWQRAEWSRTLTARDALVQTIELAQAAEEIGIDGAFVRVHHFARQLGSPFALLAAMGARTSRIELGTAVIDMRYENPLYMAEDAAAADLIAGGRLQLGISRGSPEPVLDGPEAFGFGDAQGEAGAELARAHTELFRRAIAGEGVARADPAHTGLSGLLPIQPQSEGLSERIWWGAGGRESARWVAQQGMNIMSSTLLLEDTGVPFDELQAEQIEAYRESWREAGVGAHAAGVGEPKRDPDHQRPRPYVLRTRREPRPGGLPGRPQLALRAHIHGRAGRDRRRTGRGRWRCRRRTRCC